MTKSVYLDQDNIVIKICVVNDEEITDPDGLKVSNMVECICKQKYGVDTTWIEIEENIENVEIGWTYDEKNNRFLPPKPQPNWILNEIRNWIPPVKKPDLNLKSNQIIQWNFDTNDWEVVTTE